MDSPLTRSVLPSGADVAVVGTRLQPAERAQAGGGRVDRVDHPTSVLLVVQVRAGHPARTASISVPGTLTNAEPKRFPRTTFPAMSALSWVYLRPAANRNPCFAARQPSPCRRWSSSRAVCGDTHGDPGLTGAQQTASAAQRTAELVTGFGLAGDPRRRLRHPPAWPAGSWWRS